MPLPERDNGRRHIVLTKKEEGFRSQAGRAVRQNVSIKSVGPDPELTVVGRSGLTIKIHQFSSSRVLVFLLLLLTVRRLEMSDQFQAVLDRHFQRFIGFLRILTNLGVERVELTPSLALCVVRSFEGPGVTVGERESNRPAVNTALPYIIIYTGIFQCALDKTKERAGHVWNEKDCHNEL